jgi:hypothetical protein
MVSEMNISSIENSTSWIEKEGSDDPWVRRFTATSLDGALCELVIDCVAFSLFLSCRRSGGGVDRVTREGLSAIAVEPSGTVIASFDGTLGVGHLTVTLKPVLTLTIVVLEG